METANNLDEAKPIQPISTLELEVKTEDSVKYLIKISNIGEKLNLSTSYKSGLICQEYFSQYDLKTLLENIPFSFKSIEDYFLLLEDTLENNKERKLGSKLKKEKNFLILEIPAKLGRIKEIKFIIKEKELTEKEKQDNILEFLDKIYLENQELKKKVSAFQELEKKINVLQTENEKIKEKLEQTQKKYEEENIKQKERIKNLFKDSAIVKLDEKKMINDWIDPYNEKNITSELLFRTSVDGDNAATFHNKCNNKGPTITFVKTTAGKRVGGFTMLSWASTNGYREDKEAFIFALDTYQKFVQYKDFNCAIYDHSSYGPTFGNGHDLYIASGCKSNTSSYCYSNYSYGFYNSYNLINTGNQNTSFQVADYEVYLIKINK